MRKRLLSLVGAFLLIGCSNNPPVVIQTTSPSDNGPGEAIATKVYAEFNPLVHKFFGLKEFPKSWQRVTLSWNSTGLNENKTLTLEMTVHHREVENDGTVKEWDGADDKDLIDIKSKTQMLLDELRKKSPPEALGKMTLKVKCQRIDHTETLEYTL